MDIATLKQSNRKTFSYVVEGEPVQLCKVTDDEGPKVWDTYKQTRFNYIQHVKNQHEKYFKDCCFEEGATKRRQFIEGPLRLDAVFYMREFPPRFKGQHKGEAYVGKVPELPHDTVPPIFSLFNFIDHVLQGVVYKRDCTLCSVNIKKVYDPIPRTEITITRLK